MKEFIKDLMEILEDGYISFRVISILIIFYLLFQGVK